MVDSLFNFLTNYCRGQPPTRILDCANRLIIYRTSIVRFVADNMAAFMDEARNFAAACTPFTSKDAGTNVRGNHWFCIAGHDRQNKSVRNHSYFEALFE